MLGLSVALALPCCQCRPDPRIESHASTTPIFSSRRRGRYRRLCLFRTIGILFFPNLVSITSRAGGCRAEVNTVVLVSGSRPEDFQFVARSNFPAELTLGSSLFARGQEAVELAPNRHNERLENIFSAHRRSRLGRGANTRQLRAGRGNPAYKRSRRKK